MEPSIIQVMLTKVPLAQPCRGKQVTLPESWRTTFFKNEAEAMEMRELWVEQ